VTIAARLREGAVTGAIGAGLVLTWLAIGALFGVPTATPARVVLTVLVFQVVGLLAAWLAERAEEAPATLYLAAVAFAGFEFGFFLLSPRPWWNAAVGNVLAVAGMGAYLWRRHPEIGEQLRRHPLGEAMQQLSMDRLTRQQDAGRDQLERRDG
jgi:hypothetical protein